VLLVGQCFLHERIHVCNIMNGNKLFQYDMGF
jgi:hypothetical protein